MAKIISGRKFNFLNLLAYNVAKWKGGIFGRPKMADRLVVSGPVVSRHVVSLTFGLLDNWTFGHLVFGTNELLDIWPFGHLAFWTLGLFNLCSSDFWSHDFWPFGHLEFWTFDLLDICSFGHLILWTLELFGLSQLSNVQKSKCPKDQMSTRPHLSRPRVQRPQVYLSQKYSVPYILLWCLRRKPTPRLMVIWKWQIAWHVSSSLPYIKYKNKRFSYVFFSLLLNIS